MSELELYTLENITTDLTRLCVAESEALNLIRNKVHVESMPWYKRFWRWLGVLVMNFSEAEKRAAKKILDYKPIFGRITTVGPPDRDKPVYGNHRVVPPFEVAGYSIPPFEEDDLEDDGDIWYNIANMFCRAANCRVELTTECVNCAFNNENKDAFKSWFKEKYCAD